MYDKLTITLFRDTPYEYTLPLIPALLGLIFLESALLLMFGLLGLAISFPVLKWLWFLAYIAEAFVFHLFIIVWHPRLCRWLRQRIMYNQNGVAYFRLLQATTFFATGMVVWFLWRFA